MSLLITKAPHADESGMGYYRRLAGANSLECWRNLTSTAGVERNRRALLMGSDDVARNLGLEPAWTESAAQKETLIHKWGRLHRSKSDAVCPACLAESPYLRHHWEHAYVTACSKHGLQLVDQCNACGQHLSQERIYIGLCSCGNDLGSLPRTQASEAQQWLSAQIASNSRQPCNVTPIFKEVPIEVLVKIVRTLCLYFDPNQSSLPRNAALPKSVAEAINFVAPLEALLADWPTGFRNHIEERIASGRKDARTLNTLLGDWYISLRKLCIGTTFEPLLKIIIDVAAEKSDCVLGFDSSKPMVEDLIGYMRAPDAAKAIGISVSRLHQSLQTGECEHRKQRTGTRGQVYEIPCVEVERIQQRRTGWISDGMACELAHVTPAVLERMKVAGVIRSDTHWREDIMKGGPVELLSMTELYECVERQVVPVEVTDDASITLAEFTSRRMGDKQAIESLMKAVANGEVKAITNSRTLGEFSFLRSNVAQFFGTPVLEAGMSIQQLSKATGWKWESISHWADEGLLGCESILRRGQSCRVVLPHQLLAFRQSYIPLADLARAMDTKASALGRLLPGVKLVGAKQLHHGATRGGLIQISDLGRLAVLGARAGEDLFVPAA